MASRGRPSKSALEQALKRDAPTIAETFSRSPIRQPVDPSFSPYYQRILAGDVATILDYEFDVLRSDSENSFYEVVGRLVALQSLDAAKRIVSEIARTGKNARGLKMEAYQYWYSTLRSRCKFARDFIQEAYRADGSLKRGKLWCDYIDLFDFRVKGISQTRSLNEFKAWARALDSKCEAASLYDQVSRFSKFFLVPKTIFFDLAESDKHSSNSVDLDRRYRTRRLRWTPSFIARKYACAIVGISPSSISHRNVGK
jgi:hypothetical protein